MPPIHRATNTNMASDNKLRPAYRLSIQYVVPTKPGSQSDICFSGKSLPLLTLQVEIHIFIAWSSSRT